MDFTHSAKVIELKAQLEAFMDEHVYPNEAEYDAYTRDHNNLWTQPPLMEDLKAKAREAGIWNWFLPRDYEPWSPGLSNVEFAPLAEVMGRAPWSFEVFNCSAPDRGNMEVLAKFGTAAQQERWLTPLLAGEIRSTFGMTEPQVASSDATNMELTIVRDGDDYVLNGRKWWSSNIMHPLNRLLVVLGVTDPNAERHERHSMILVPRDTSGLEVVRPLTALESYDSPGGHGELRFTDARVPAGNLIWGEGKGFAIAQGRLGPGRFQYAMTCVGAAQRVLDLMCHRVEERVAFGQKLSKQSSIRQDIAKSRCEIEQARLLVLRAAAAMDEGGIEAAREYLPMVKIVGPNMCWNVAERAMQAFGGKGVSSDTIIPKVWAMARTMRIADGPDQVHMSQLGKMTIARALNGG